MVVCVFAENMEILAGNKIAGNKTEAEKITILFGFFRIIFVAFNNFYAFRISNGNIDLVFEKIKNGDLILISRLHTDIKTGIIKKPLLEAPDILLKVEKHFSGKRAGHLW